MEQNIESAVVETVACFMLKPLRIIVKASYPLLALIKLHTNLNSLSPNAIKPINL